MFAPIHAGRRGGSQAEQLLNMLLRYDVVAGLHFLADAHRILDPLSKRFQANGLTLLGMREATKDAVKKVKERLGGEGTSPHYNDFLDLYGKDGTFKRVALTLNAPRDISAFEEDIALYCATVESELCRRFLEPELETFMQAACVLDHSSWPE